MKKSLLYVLLSLSSMSYAQDQLFKKDNSKVEVKILEINQDEIKYKLFTYQDGPIISIAKKEVALIIYQNGVHEVINTAYQAPPTVMMYNNDYSTSLMLLKHQKDSLKATRFKELTSTKNLVSFNGLGLFNSSISINYLREFWNNRFNIYVPISVGFAQPIFNQTDFSLFGNNYNSYITNFRFTKKVIDIGVGIHFQTNSKHAVTHFVGPYIGMSQFNGAFRQLGYGNIPNYNYSSSVEHVFVMNRYYFMIDNGFLFRITKHFNMLLIASIGHYQDVFIANDPKSFSIYNNYNYNYNYSDYEFPINSFKFGLSFGYRF